MIAARKSSSLVEVLGVFALIMLYIWWLRWHYRWLWVAILAIIVASHFIRKEGPARLGFGWSPLKLSWPVVFAWLLNLVMGLWGTGVVFGTLRDTTFPGLISGLCFYTLWGAFQQYLLNGYCVNRLAGFFGNPNSHAVPLSAGLLFSAAHTPNWFLMLVTLPAGYFCARLFVRYRSVLSLGLAHGILGYLLYVVVPDSISGHLLVGPRYWSQP